MDLNVSILAKLEESKMSNDDRVEDIETEDTLTDNLKLLNKENISNVLGMHLKMNFYPADSMSRLTASISKNQSLLL